LEEMKKLGMSVPPWIDEMAQSGATQFYRPNHQVYEPQGYRSMLVADDAIDLPALKADPHVTLWQNAEAALLDLGDGVALYEFRSKGNTLGMRVLNGLSESLDLIE